MPDKAGLSQSDRLICSSHRPDPCFIVRDANGQALAFVYCEDEPARRTTGKLLIRDEARRIALNIAKPRAIAPVFVLTSAASPEVSARHPLGAVP